MAKKATRRTSARTGAARSKTTRKASKSAPAAREVKPRRPRGKGKTPSKDFGVRPAWSGNLRLALVSVPVKLFPATRTGARIQFHQVHEPSGKRIRYDKMVPGIGPVDRDEIVKGFEVEKGRYVLLTDDEIESVKVEAKKTLDLVQFVDASEIGPIWFDRPYYVVPDGELAEEAYGVMRDALRKTKRIGLGQFVMRGREYLAALKPCGNGMLVETLRFADELRAAAPFFAGMEDIEPDPELLSLAKELIERKTAPFDAERFEDQYTEALRALIDVKAGDASAAVEVEEEEPPSGGRIIDLVEALKRSVNQAETGGGGSRKKRAG